MTPGRTVICRKTSLSEASQTLIRRRMSDWRPDLGSGVETCPSPFHVVKTRRAVVSLAQGDDNQDRTFRPCS